MDRWVKDRGDDTTALLEFGGGVSDAGTFGGDALDFVCDFGGAGLRVADVRFMIRAARFAITSLSLIVESAMISVSLIVL